MDQRDSNAYAMHIADQLGKAVDSGDTEAANGIVDQVAADGHPVFAAILNAALTQTSLAETVEDPPALNVAEEYAVWLVTTGAIDAATDDMNEGGDPVSARDDEVTSEDWRAAIDLTHEIVQWIQTNPATLLALVRATGKT